MSGIILEYIANFTGVRFDPPPSGTVTSARIQYLTLKFYLVPNQKQKIVVIVAVILIGLSYVFPPFRTITATLESGVLVMGYDGHKPLFLGADRFQTIDHELLLIQCLFIVTMSAGLVWVFQVRKEE